MTGFGAVTALTATKLGAGEKKKAVEPLRTSIVEKFNYGDVNFSAQELFAKYPPPCPLPHTALVLR